MQLVKLDPDSFVIVWACGNCGAAETWEGCDAVDYANTVPTCGDCEQPMHLASVCVRQ